MKSRLDGVQLIYFIFFKGNFGQSTDTGKQLITYKKRNSFILKT